MKMRFDLSKIISADWYNLTASAKAQAFKAIGKGGFALDHSIHRLRNLILDLTIAVVLNSILFFSYFKTQLFDLFYIHLMLALILQFWWGAIRVFTRDIQNKLYFDDNSEVKKLVNKWLVDSSFIAGATLFLLVGIFAWLFPDINKAVVLFLLIRFIFKFLYKIFESLSFSLNRVPVPFYYAVTADILFVSVIYFSVSYNNALLNLFLLILSLGFFGFFWHIATKQAQNLGIMDIGYFVKRLKALDFKPKFDNTKNFLLLGFAGLALSSNLLLLFNAKVSEFYSIFLLLPFMIVCQSWLMPFYFDLTDTRILINKKLRANYIKYLFKAMPLVFVLICFIYQIFCLYFKIETDSTLLIFIFINLIFSVFVYNEFSKMNLTTLIFILVSEVLIISISGGLFSSMQLLIIFKSLGIVYFIFNPSTNNNILQGLNFVIPADIWQDMVEHSDNEQQIYVFKLNTDTKDPAVRAVSKKIALLVGEGGKVGIKENFLLIFSNKEISKDKLIETAGGTITFHQEFDSFSMPDDFVEWLNGRQPAF
jgi:hypothetical protein